MKIMIKNTPKKITISIAIIIFSFTKFSFANSIRNTLFNVTCSGISLDNLTANSNIIWQPSGQGCDEKTQPFRTELSIDKSFKVIANVGSKKLTCKSLLNNNSLISININNPNPDNKNLIDLQIDNKSCQFSWVPECNEPDRILNTLYSSVVFDQKDKDNPEVLLIPSIDKTTIENKPYINSSLSTNIFKNDSTWLPTFCKTESNKYIEFKLKYGKNVAQEENEATFYMPADGTPKQSYNKTVNFIYLNPNYPNFYAYAFLDDLEQMYSIHISQTFVLINLDISMNNPGSFYFIANPSSTNTPLYLQKYCSPTTTPLLIVESLVVKFRLLCFQMTQENWSFSRSILIL